MSILSYCNLHHFPGAVVLLWPHARAQGHVHTVLVYRSPLPGEEAVLRGMQPPALSQQHAGAEGQATATPQQPQQGLAVAMQQ